MIYSQMLGEFAWLRHGFGTRDDVFPGTPEAPARLKQIHSALVHEARQGGLLGEGDALVSAQSNLELRIRTADCYPVLLADPRNRAVAAIHAGWRGTASKIVPEALRQMRKRFGTQVSEVTAAIGPGIGVCCYQVGPEVAHQFGITANSPVHIDLAATIHHQLLRAGVPEAQIEALGMCTFCHPENFFSFRRERERAGRMTSFIGVFA